MEISFSGTTKGISQIFQNQFKWIYTNLQRDITCSSCSSVDLFHSHSALCWFLDCWRHRSQVVSWLQLKGRGLVQFLLNKCARICLPMAKKMSLTFMPVFADVSMKSNPFSSAYCFASSNSTTRMLDRSALLPANAMTMFGEA